MEKTLIVLKPDAVQRQLVGQIIGRFEQKGLRLVALRMLSVGPELAGKMYAVHEGKDFYQPLIEFITAGPVVAMVWQGRDAISVARKMMGPTFGPDAPAGTIRGDLGMSRRYNLIHGSDSPESAAKEIPLFFGAGEIIDYTPVGERWIYARQGEKLI
ncbi:MAG: nucleoside-diphosphate kinase [Planctomycetes bacterium]|nr:nucleoside-diphosphate kinase [Planctomycetota bacterium]